MIVGTLGDIVFETSSRYILTFNNFVQTVSARYATHERHATTALTEFTGIDPEGITFDIIMSSYLGADPAAQLEVLRKYVRGGTAVSLVLGTTVYGDYRWVITGYKVKAEHFSQSSVWNSVTCSVTLQEYLENHKER